MIVTVSTRTGKPIRAHNRPLRLAVAQTDEADCDPLARLADAPNIAQQMSVLLVESTDGEDARGVGGGVQLEPAGDGGEQRVQVGMARQRRIEAIRQQCRQRIEQQASRDTQANLPAITRCKHQRGIWQRVAEMAVVVAGSDRAACRPRRLCWQSGKDGGSAPHKS
jgi:hypothetical protein